MRAWTLLPALFLVAGCALFEKPPARAKVEAGTTSIQHERTLPTVEREQREIRHVDPETGKVTGTEHVDRTVTTGDQVKSTASATGASGESVGSEAALKLKSEPAELTLPGGATAAGGGVDADGNAKGGSVFNNPLLWVGIVLVIAAVAVNFIPLGSIIIPKRLVLGVGALGACFIVASFMPLWFWIVVGVGLLVLGLTWVGGEMDLHKQKKNLQSERQHRNVMKEGLRAVVAGVAHAPREAKEIVKASIARHADAADLVTIANIKAEDGL